MDIADISKVSSRKRMNIEAEKLREKVSRETSKIIKLKVAQDTAYWDLKEKLHQLENNHERLQQNMVEVQMQHESISGQYQDELRLRPETLNKLSSTRQICDVLEEYSSRLKETMSRCKSDQAALCEAYQKSGHLVRDIKLKQQQNEERSQGLVAGLQEKLTLTTEHQKQLLQLFAESQRQAEERSSELREKLETSSSQREELMQIVNSLTRELDQLKVAGDAKDKNIATLQNDMKQLLHEFNNQCGEMKTTITKQEKDLKDSTESIESLKQALHNQEQFTNKFCEKNNDLQEKITNLEDEAAKLYDEVSLLQGKLLDYKSTCDLLRKDMAGLAETKQSLETDLAEKSQLLNNTAGEVERLMTQLNAMEIEKSSLTTNLENANKLSEEKTTAIEEYKATIRDFEAKVLDLEKALQDCRSSNEDRIKELSIAIETKTTENTSKGETINKLINEIKMCMEVRSRLETNIDKMKKEIEYEREMGMEKEMKFAKQVEMLNSVVKDKEQELSKQMSIILEMRGEKEKLQEKISRMQSTIDNIQKELTAPRAPRDTHDPPELDDNAVQCAPKLKNHIQSQHNRECTDFAKPAHPQKQPDSMLYNIFSDSSMDGDGLDPVEVNRRFEAISRGEKIPPLPLSALKRRRLAPASQSRDKGHTMQDTPISLSQVRNEAKRGNTFFRTKRNENKLKRFKKIDETETSEH